MKNWMITWLVGNAMKHVATKDLEITYESGSIANCILATFMNRYKTYFFCRYFMYWGNLNAASNGPVEFSTHLSTLECVEIPENLLQFPIQYIPVEIRMGFALKKIAPRFTIPPDTIQFLYQLYQQGQVSGQKTEPEAAHVSKFP